MNNTVSEVLELIKENDIKFIRLGFCDLFGTHKNISIIAEELPAAFESGVSFDAHAIKAFRDVTQSDLFLFPDPTTFTVLSWRPAPGRVAHFYCDIKNPDGSPFLHTGRYLLKDVLNKYEKLGYVCKIGAECEFYLFKTDENGEPTMTTLDNGEYLDISPLDKGEDIRREICLTLDEMGIYPESSHHEQGPGQNEIDFKFSDAMECADNLLTFKSVVKAVAMRNGLFASFMPKPISDAAGNGLHVNLSLTKDGVNVFKNVAMYEESKVAENFMAGVLSKAPEITLFLNPIANSYDRFGTYEATKYVSWSHQNRSQLVRIPAAAGEKERMELRSPDPTISPHLAFAMILAAGLEGIEKGMDLPDPVDENLFTAPKSKTKDLTELPKSLKEAIEIARESEFVKSIIGEELLTKYIDIKEVEANAFEASKNKATFYKKWYWGII